MWKKATAVKLGPFLIKWMVENLNAVQFGRIL